jgi:hypothetical protein
MKTKGYPCKREKQPVTEKIDALMVYYVFTPDGRSLIDYALIFGKIKEEIVIETANEESYSSEGKALIHPTSQVVVLDIFMQHETNISGLPMFTETRTRWLYVDNHGWLMVWKKVYEHGFRYTRVVNCVMYELPEDALKVYRGLRVKASPRTIH